MTLINFTINKKAKRKIYGIIGALLTLIIPFFIIILNRGVDLEKKQSLCPFKMLTGFPCPGCGITKSMVSFYEGNLYKSFYYHLFGPFVLFFCVLTILVLVTELTTRKEYFNSILFNKKIAYFLATILVVYHLMRLFYFIYSNSFESILKQSIWK